jgi:ABC-type cobalamin transport system permease subunit
MTTVHNRKALIALTIAVAFVAIVVPTCRMVGCSMSMGGAMPFGHQGAPGFFGDCGGTLVSNSTPSAVVPAGADALVLALVSAVIAALALFRPEASVQRVRVAAFEPPPPPDDPEGERLRL